MPVSSFEGFAFIIDTNEYAGNFEREMCAYMTAQYGDCEVGLETAESVRDKIPPNVLEWFEDNLNSEPDNNGCYRPVSGMKNPRNKKTPFSSVGIFMSEEPPPHVLKVLKERAEEFSKNPTTRWASPFVVEGFRLVERRYTETEKVL